MAEQPELLSAASGRELAYHHSAGAAPTVVFLAGYASDMTGTKTLRLEAHCRERGRAYLRLDYSGHGASSGSFVEGTIGDWTDDVVAVAEAATEGPLVLVGSSMGGWIMLLAALAMPARVAGLVGIAAAPDFTEELMWSRFDAEQRLTLEREGELYLPSDYVEEPYPVTSKLIEEGRRHLLLGRPIPIECPVRLIHGLADLDVPWSTSVRLAADLASRDVRITLVKDGGHRLSEPAHLELLCATVDEMTALCSACR